MYQTHNHPNIMQYLAILDKCTQIIRQDRIWLRNLIKGNNQDALLLFKGVPKIPDMKQLQIKIRKYINRAKQKQKQDQLQRFKENMNFPQFIDTAAQKRVEDHSHNKSHNKSQNKARNPLIQNQPNYSKNSFVAKWNNYSHHNTHSNNFLDNKSQISEKLSIQQNNQQNILKKQWINNYKPHSFNKGLNGELANKLSNKNKSVTNFKKIHQANAYCQDKYSFRGQNEVKNFTQTFGYNGRNSSKSLRQLQNKINQDLSVFQRNKVKKQAEQHFNKTYSQQSVEKNFGSQVPYLNFPETQKSSNFSKQNIDSILKFKLGNCDFQSYKNQRSFQNQEQNDYVSVEKNQSQKKLYNQGYFPAIQEQTQRDSQSQRYPQQPLRFGLGSKQDAVGFNSKQQLEDKQRFLFSSFAKSSPNHLHKTLKINQIGESQSRKQRYKIAQFYENEGNIGIQNNIDQHVISNHFGHLIYEQPIPQKNASESLCQSVQRRSEAADEFIQSDLHKSIMNSIRKSRQQFPVQLFPQAPKTISNLMPKQCNFTQINQSKISTFEKSEPKINKSQTGSCRISKLQASQEKINRQFLGRSGTSIADSITLKPFNEGNISQSLFTSPELLNQCRNFLKKTQQINFQNSGLANLSSSYQTNKFESPSSSQSKSFKNSFASNVLHFPQPITITESITKDFYEKDSASKINSLFQSKLSSHKNQNQNIQFQTYSKPSNYFNQNSFKKSQYLQSSSKKPVEARQVSQPSSLQKNENFFNLEENHNSLKKHLQIQQQIKSIKNQDHQQKSVAIAPLLNSKSNQKQQINNQANGIPQSMYKTSQFTNNFTQQSNKKSSNKFQMIWSLIDLQDVIDILLQANEGNIQIESLWLKHTLGNHYIFSSKVGEVLKEVLKQFTERQATYNLIEIINQLEKQYKKNPKYQQRKCPSRDIYLLLDIQQKGFITFQDLKSFIVQLEQAQVQNLDDIKNTLVEVFQLADFASAKRISYTNLYIIKNQDLFSQLCQYLQQFQFEIQGQE